MNTSKTTKLEGLVVRRKATGEIFTITGRDEDGFFQMNGGSDNGGRDVMGSELNYYERVYQPAPCDCGGTGWLEVKSNVWTGALFSDPRRAYAYQKLGSSFKPCTCNDASKLYPDRPHKNQKSPPPQLPKLPKQAEPVLLVVML